MATNGHCSHFVETFPTQNVLPPPVPRQEALPREAGLVGSGSEAGGQDPPSLWPSSTARWGRKSSPPTGAAAHPHSAATVQEEQGVGVASSEGQPGPRAGISLGQQAG